MKRGGNMVLLVPRTTKFVKISAIRMEFHCISFKETSKGERNG